MFILITFIVLDNVFVNAILYEVKLPQTQGSIAGTILSNSGINLKSLKQLAKAFPNHAIEIQIDRTPEDPSLVRSYRRKPAWLRHNPEFYKKSPYEIMRSDIKKPNTEVNTTVTATTTMGTTTATAMATTTTTASNKIPDDLKRPLYMEDLIKALQDFDIKTKSVNTGNNRNSDTGPCGITSTTKDGNRPVVVKDLWDLEKFLSSNCNSNHHESESASIELASSNFHIKNTAVRNFNDVIKLIQKGVKVQLEVTTPADSREHLNWVPIKVQKDFKK